MCVRLCVLVWLSCSCSRREALPPGGPAPRSPTPALLPAGPTSSRDSLLCKLSTSRPRLSFSSCLSASSCCSSCTCREAVGGLSGPLGKTLGSWPSSFPPPSTLPVSPGCGGSWPPPLAADGRKGPGLGSGLGGLPGLPPAQWPSIPTTDVLWPILCQTPFRATNSFIYSFTHLLKYSSIQ